MTDHNAPISDQYAAAAEAWVDADAAASLLEDSRSSVLSQMILENSMGDKPHNRVEAQVKASPSWRDYIKHAIEARRAANLLKIKMEVLRMKHSEFISQDANNRTIARL